MIKVRCPTGNYVKHCRLRYTDASFPCQSNTVLQKYTNWAGYIHIFRRDGEKETTINKTEDMRASGMWEEIGGGKGPEVMRELYFYFK